MNFSLTQYYLPIVFKTLRLCTGDKAPALALATTVISAPKNNNLLSQCITTLEEKLDGILGNMQDTMGKILQTLADFCSAIGIGPSATGMLVLVLSNSF